MVEGEKREQRRERIMRSKGGKTATAPRWPESCSSIFVGGRFSGDSFWRSKARVVLESLLVSENERLREGSSSFKLTSNVDLLLASPLPFSPSSMDFPTPSSLADLVGLSLGDGSALVREMTEEDVEKAY